MGRIYPRLTTSFGFLHLFFVDLPDEWEAHTYFMAPRDDSRRTTKHQGRSRDLALGGKERYEEEDNPYLMVHHGGWARKSTARERLLVTNMIWDSRT